MRRGIQLTTIAMGAVLALLLGSGLVALTSDTATSTGNNVKSGTFTPLTHDLDIAQVTAVTGDCGTAAYTESSSAAISVVSGTSLNLDSGARIEQGLPTVSQDFCLKNAGTAAGSLSLQFTGVTDTENLCSTNEDTLGGDTSCGEIAGVPGDGELRPMLRPAFSLGTDTSDCTALTQAAWSTYEIGAQEFDPALDPNEICRVHLTVFQTTGASDATKLIAQTDEVRWTISFVLQD